MSMMPWGMSPMMNPMWDVTPWSSSADLWPWTGASDICPSMIRPMERSLRRMEREAGKLLSSVKEDDKTFQVMVDVTQFRPEEITVKTTDKNVIIHGKHEERTDQHGYVSREFRRRVTLPAGVNPETVTSTISPSGVLTVMAPKMALEGAKERTIPITMATTAGAVGAGKAQESGSQTNVAA